MRNTYLRSRTEVEIDKLVKKILHDVGNPEPPLRIPDVLDRLKLDRGYYSTTNDGFLRENIHQLKVAGKQVLKRPSLLLDAIKKMSIKALFLPDRKRILIDEELPPAKIRWAEVHEVIHSVVPWHDTLMHGDTKQTLTLGCSLQLEAEANFGAGRLLFLQDRFRGHLGSGRMSMHEIKGLATLYGNSITSTMWRAIETVDYPALGIISGHPHHPGKEFDAANPCEYLIRSRSFEAQFDHVNELELFEHMRNYCKWVKKGPLGSEEIILADANGDDHVFAFETFHNSYQALTVGLHVSKRPTVITT